MAQPSQQRGGGGDLILPETLKPEERAAALMLVEHCDQAQALLDELSARMQSNTVRTTPIAYLRGLIARANAGTFIPEAGLRIALARRRRNEEAREFQHRELEAQRLAAERASPAYHAKVTARRAEIRQWLDRLKPRSQGGERP